MAQTDPAAVISALRKNKLRQEVRKNIQNSSMSPAMQDWNQEMFGRTFGAALPRDPAQFLDGTFTPLTPIQPVAINVPEGEDDRPEPRQRQMPPGWNMPVGEPGTEGFKLASFSTLRTYADIYSVARACIQTRKNEIRGLEWDIMPTEEAEKKMRGDAHMHRDFNERKKQVVAFFKRPDPDYLGFGSYVDAIMEEMLVTDALSLYLHPTQKKGGYGPFGKDVSALEIISGSTIRPLVNNRGGRVRPPSPAYQQYLYGVPRVDLMQMLQGSDQEEIKELGKPAKQYRSDQLLYVPYTQRSWTPYGFPPLERTLIPTVTGLRKQQYQLDYFDEGTIPGQYISPGEQLGWSPNQLQIWQNQQNALAGDPAYKHKSVALPPGSKVFPIRPVQLADQFDEIVMTQVCMGYDVMPMEMGISPKVSTTQSPGAANQMAKATEKTNERKSLKPTLAFMTDIFNLLIQVVWVQQDMRFVFEGLEEDEDENALVERLVQMIQYGLYSIDEARISLNKAPWGLPITSDPVYVNPTVGLVPIGSIDPTTGKPMGTPPPAAIGGPPPMGGAPGGPPGVGGPPKPAGAVPGNAAPGAPAPGGAPAGAPAGGSPSGRAPGSGTPVPGQPGPGPGGEPKNPADAIHPDDKVGQSRQAVQEVHAGLQQGLHEDFAAGKPLEPPVRPPISEQTEDPEHGDKDNQQEKRPQRSTKAMLSELESLVRQHKRGRAPSDWKCKHLTTEIVDYYETLTKHLSPDDSAAVTIDFVTLAYGPPVLQAKLNDLDKTFSTDSPLDSQDGNQGLAPYDLASGLQQICPKCLKPKVDGHSCTASINKPPDGLFDNGATADGGPNGVTKSVVLPKALGKGTRAWPGWTYDLQLARIYSAQLEIALAAVADPRRLAEDYLGSSHPVVKGALSVLAQQAWGWLNAQGYNEKLRRAVSHVLTNLWTEGFAVGRESGKEMVDSAYDSTFWGKWNPGDPDAARLTAGPGLQKLLQDYGIATIRSVTATKLGQLANTLADGFSKGDSAETIAAAVKPVLSNPTKARLIATTELARATTQAAVGEYREAGFAGKSWSETGNPPDERVCPRCRKNADQGIIPMDQPFDSGDVFTPAHPVCRCAILPEDLPQRNPSLVKGLSPLQLELIAEDLGKGLGIDEIMKYVAPHLFKSDQFVAGGLAVRAKDTGRVLMIQRAHDEDDPAGGQWEFPGGRLEGDESVEDAARREWSEETGLPVPAGHLVGLWDTAKYRGHVLSVGSEDACPILGREPGSNPDDPDDEAPEAIAWWDPSELKDNPAVRDELREHPKRVRRALEATGDKVGKSAHSDAVDTLDRVYQQLLANYPPDSIEWVRRATWSGPHKVPWSLVDHDDMDKWAASHQPEKVDHFVARIKAGDDPHPAVLVADPDGNYIDVDGHHRALAYHRLGLPVRSWTGTIDPADRLAMEETHLDQVHEGNDPKNKLAKVKVRFVFVPPVTKASEHDHHIAGTPFTYHHGWIPINPGDCNDGCGAQTKGGKYLPGHDAKHVSHLASAVQSGAITHQQAHDALSHSEKLQGKLAKKLGPPPSGAAPTPAEATHPAPGEDPFAGEPAPPSKIATGTTPDGRDWSATVVPGGVGSVYHIAAKEGVPAGPRDQELRFTYLGNGKVKLERKVGGDWQEDAGSSIEALKQRTAVYKAAAGHMDSAKSEEDTAKKAQALADKINAKPAAPAAPAAPAPVNSGGHALKPWDPKSKTHLAAKKILDDEPVPDAGEGTVGSAANKAYVAQRVAAKMSGVGTSDFIAALYPDGFTAGVNQDAMIKAAKDPSAWKYIKSYGTLDLYPASDTLSSAKPLTDKVLREAAVSQLISTWAMSSNNHNVRSLAIQESAKKEFGLDSNVAPWETTAELSAQIDKAVNDHGTVYQKFLRAQYDTTQEDLNAWGIKELNVMRGMKWSSSAGTPAWTKGIATGNKIPTPPLRPLSSWTVNAATASSFASSGSRKVTLKATIPATSILSWPRSGFGCLSEYEVVAMPGGGQVTVGPATLG